VASSEGFASRSRVVVAVSFGPKVYKFFLPVLTSFDHAFLARPGARSRLIARHAGFTQWHNISLRSDFLDTRCPLDFFLEELGIELLF
jgi:hypothetical protein